MFTPLQFGKYFIAAFAAGAAPVAVQAALDTINASGWSTSTAMVLVSAALGAVLLAIRPPVKKDEQK
jgi:hypothetical protein